MIERIRNAIILSLLLLLGGWLETAQAQPEEPTYSISYTLPKGVSKMHWATYLPGVGKVTEADKRSIPAGAQLTFEATIESGYEVDRWEVNGQVTPHEQASYDSSLSIMDIEMPAKDTNVALFMKGQANSSDDCVVHLETTAGGKLMASYIDRNPFTQEEETIYVNDGTTVPKYITLEIVATPDTGYKVGQWYQNGSPIADAKGSKRQAITIREETTIKVDFESANQDFEGYIFTFQEDSPEGTITAYYEDSNWNRITVHSGQKVPVWSYVFFTATPKEGYEIDYWTIGGKKDDHGFLMYVSEDTRKISSEANETIGVVFKKKVSTEGYTVHYAIDEGGSIKSALYYDKKTYDYVVVHDGDRLPKGTEIEIEVELQRGYTVDGWYLNDQLIEGSKGKKSQTIVLNEDSRIQIKLQATPRHAVTFSASTGGQVSAAIIGKPINSGDEVPEGSYVTFTATPDGGYVVDKWIINGEENSRYAGKSEISERVGKTPLTIEVSFKDNRGYTVTYTGNNDWGMLSANYDKPNGQNVALQSGETVPDRTDVYFVASPNKGYIIDRWLCNDKAVDATNNNLNCTIPVCEDVTIRIVARKLEMYVVMFVDVADEGTIQAYYWDPIAGKNIEVSPGDNVPEGTRVTFEATPSEGYEFDHWTVNYLDVDNEGQSEPQRRTTVVEMTEHMTVEAHFKEKSTNYILTFNEAPTGGTVKASYSAMDASGFKEVTLKSGDPVPEGAMVTMTATPSEGYEFDHWIKDGSPISAADGGSRAEYTLEMLASCEVQAVFEQTTPAGHKITYTAGAGGSLKCFYSNGSEVNSGDLVEDGVALRFNATPESGYKVNEWTINGQPFAKAKGKKTIIQKASKDLNVEVSFVADVVTYTISYEAKPVAGGSIEAYYTIGQNADKHHFNSGDKLPQGANISFTAKPNEGYRFVKWVKNGADVSDYTDPMAMGTYLMADATADLSVQAVFEETVPTYAVIFSAGEGGTITATLGADKTPIQSGDKVQQYSHVTFTATPNEGYMVDQWMVDGQKQMFFAGKTELKRTVRKAISVEVTFKADIPAKQCTINYTKDNDWGTLVAYYDTQSGRTNINPGDQVEEGYMLTFLATPKEGYLIDHWTYNGTKTSTVTPETLTVRVTEDMTVAIVCKKPALYTVTFDADTEGGKMTASYLKDEGFNGYKDIYIQSGDQVPAGAEMTFVVTPNEGYKLEHWLVNGETRACDRYNPLRLRDLVIDKDTEVKAVYKKKAVLYTVTYSAGEGGMIMGTSEDAKTRIESGSQVEGGTTLRFIAVPEAANGYMVDQWLINDVVKEEYSGKAFILVPITGNTNVKVTFKTQAKYKVSFTSDNPWGTLEAQYYHQGIVPVLPEQEVKEGTEVFFKAIASEGYEIDAWTCNGKPIEYESLPDRIYRAKLIIKEDSRIELQYHKKVVLYEVTYSAGEGGRIIGASRDGKSEIASGSQVEEGTYMRFSAIPNEAEGYKVDQWSVNGEIQSELAGRAFILWPIKAKTDVTVTFKKEQAYTVTYTPDNEWGSITAYYYDKGKKVDVRPMQKVQGGVFVEFEATVKEGYLLDNWTCNGEVLPTADVHKAGLTLQSDVIIDMQYHKIAKYTITYEASSDKGTIEASYIKNENFQYIKTPIASGDQLEASTEVTFEATAGEGYELDYWTINAEKAVASKGIKLEGNKLIITLDKDVTVAASFKGDGPVVNYGFDLVGEAVTSANINKLHELAGVSIDKEGYIRYDATTRTLSIKDVSLDAPSALLFAKGAEAYTLELAGTNSFTGQLSTESTLTITGQGTLLVSNEERAGISVGSGATLLIQGKECIVDVKTTSETGVGAIHGVWDAQSCLKIDGATIKAESTITGTAETPFPYAIGGFKSIESINGKITLPEHGKIGQHTFTFGGKEYTLAFVLGADSKPASKVLINYFNVGISDITETQLSVYPNPCAEHIVITIPAESIGETAYLLSIEGELMQQIVLSEVKTTLHTDMLSSGTYILRVDNQTKVLIKE